MNWTEAHLLGDLEAMEKSEMTDLIKRDDVLKLARLFHENYEALAPEYGYKTRDETKDFDPTTANGQLMIATCSAVLSALPPATQDNLLKWRKL